MFTLKKQNKSTPGYFFQHHLLEKWKPKGIVRYHLALVNRQSTRNKWSRGMEKTESSFFFIKGMQMAKSHSKKQ